MKKIIALIMAVAVIASMGIVSSFAEEVAGPVWFWDFSNGGTCDANSAIEIMDDCAYFMDGSEGGDGMLFFGDNMAFITEPVREVNGGQDPNLRDGKFVVVKIKLEEVSIANPNKVEVLAIPDLTKQTEVAQVSYELESTTEWQYALMDATTAQYWDSPVGSDGVVIGSNWFRLDPVNYTGSECYVAWLGLFKTQADAEAYIADDKAANAEATEAPTEAPTEEATAVADATQATGGDSTATDAATGDNTTEDDDNGCGSVIVSGAAVMAVMAAAVVFMKKRK